MKKQLVRTSNTTFEQNGLELLNEIFGGCRGDKYDFYTKLLQFSISQLLEHNKLEVFPER